MSTEAYQEKSKLAFIDGRGKQATRRPKTKFMSLEEEVEYLRAQNLLLKKVNPTKKGILTTEQKFKFIDQYASEFSVSLLLKLTTVSSSGYYKKSKSKSPKTQDETLYSLILEVFEASKRTYGVQRIKAALLNKHGLLP